MSRSNRNPLRDPLRDEAGIDIKVFGQRDLASDCFDGAGNGIHGGNLVYLSMAVNSSPKCADERQRIASLSMAAPVSVDPAEADAAALFKRLIDASDWTHESFAAEVEVSPGRVSQWATNRGPIPAERAIQVASLLGTQPELISPEWRRLLGQFLQSQTARLDGEMLDAIFMVAKKFAGLTGAQRLDPKRHAGPFADALRLTMRQAFGLPKETKNEPVRGNGADRRFNSAASQRQNDGERQAENVKPSKRAVSAAGRV